MNGEFDISFLVALVALVISIIFLVSSIVSYRKSRKSKIDMETKTNDEKSIK